MVYAGKIRRNHLLVFWLFKILATDLPYLYDIFGWTAVQDIFTLWISLIDHDSNLRMVRGREGEREKEVRCSFGYDFR